MPGFSFSLDCQPHSIKWRYRILSIYLRQQGRWLIRSIKLIELGPTASPSFRHTVETVSYTSI